jgi:MFS family permease
LLLPSQLALLKNAHFSLLFAARTISVIGDQFTYVAIPFAVLTITHSVALVGIVLTARLVPYIVFLLIGGVYSDRLPKSRILVSSEALCGICQLILGTMILLGVANVQEMVGLNLIYGFSSSFFQPASSGIIPDLVGSEETRSANALVGISLSFGNIAGPALAGILVAVAGAGWAIEVDGVSFVISSVLLLFIGRTSVAPRVNGQRFLKELIEGWHVVRARVWLWCSITYFGLFQVMVLGSFYVIGPFVAERSLGGASAWGTLMAGSGIGGLIGGLLLLRIKPARLLLGMYIALFGVAPALFAMAASAPFAVILITVLLWGGSFTYGGALWETAMQQHVPRHALSRAIAYDYMASTVLRPVGLIAFGQLANAAGPAWPLALAGAGTLLLTLGMLLIPEVRKVLCVRVERDKLRRLKAIAHNQNETMPSPAQPRCWLQMNYCLR